MSGPTEHPFDERPFDELMSSGLLWLINATVFHPRGFALAIVCDADDGAVLGWQLLGDGGEPWSFPDSPEVHALFASASALLAPRTDPGS